MIPPDLHAARDADRAIRKKEEDPVAHGSQVVARLQRTTVYLLENVASEVCATDIRRKANRGQSIHGLVSARVEEYILKQGLYR